MSSQAAILGQVNALSAASSDNELTHCVLEIQKSFPVDEAVAATLAEVLARSGEIFSFDAANSADVASTGAPTSLSTLLTPLLLRAGNATVPKLGVPGRPAGGIDCLAQIPGYRANLSKDEVLTILRSTGYAHFLAEGAMAPLDGRMFRLRQTIGAQQVPTLVAASLLSKKLAVGVKTAGLDVRVAPHGNFGTTWTEAEVNASLFSGAARRLGLLPRPVLTDSRFPNQPFLGRGEALAALANVFASKSNSWLSEHLQVCRTLAAVCVSDEQRAAVFNATPDILLREFERNLTAQGSTLGAFEGVVEQTLRGHTRTLTSSAPGFFFVPIDKIRSVFVDAQSIGATPATPFPDPLGLIFLKRPGDWVEIGEPIATLRAQREDLLVESQIRDLICRPKKSPCSPGLEGVYD